MPFWFPLRLRQPVAQEGLARRLEPRDVPGNLTDAFFPLRYRRRVFEAVVVVASSGDVGGRRSIVLTRLAIDALPFVAAMINALGASSMFEGLIRVDRPPLASLLDPLRSVEGSALWRTATLRMVGVGAPEPVLA